MSPFASSSRLTLSLLRRSESLNLRCSSSSLDEVSTTTSKFRVAQRFYWGASCSGIVRFGSVADSERNNKEAAAAGVKPRSVTVHVAHELLQAGHHYLDVRTSDEFSTGHPSGATNIPYMFQNGGMLKNSKFLDEVSSRFGKNDKIIVGCKSGRRSLMAAADLQSAGFTHVIDVAGGYSAWAENELPTTK